MNRSMILHNTSANNTDEECDFYIHRNIARILLPLVYSIICIGSIFGNVLAIMAIKRKQKKLNSTTLYSMNLVISDILFATVLPTRIVYYARGFNWPLGEALCRITALICYSNIYASVSFMACLSMDRFIAVLYPFGYSKFRNINNVKKLCIIIWILILCQTLPLLLTTMSQEIQDNFTTCMEYPNFEKLPNLPELLLVACIVGYILPMSLMLFTYSKVSLKLVRIAKENPLTERSGRNKKANNVILLVLFVFFICFTPYHVVIMQHMIKKLRYTPTCQEKQHFQIALHLTVSIMNLNCCLDPFIYFFACKGYRRIVLKIIKRPVSASISSGIKSTVENCSPGTVNHIQITGTGVDTNM
ncbi:G-protein coupled receptor 183-A [Narcine bancroftii]|uniref:G-protein coupled receptor 183-A n=1 Tax=Narcine bancroftii TaxID=1343680 RepID=UPI0038314BB6